MGFYVRKSVKAGPFRFNLSKSGLGVSAGIPGFRVGSGPRGNYIHAGRGGVYYRASLGKKRRSGMRPSSVSESPTAVFVPSDGVLLHDATGVSAERLIPTGPGDLVEQLNSAARAHRFSLWLALLLLIILLAQPTVGALLLVPGVPAVAWLWLHDRARRSVVAFYDVNDDVERWFENVVDRLEGLAASNKVWRVNAAGRVQTTYQYKVNSGATAIVSRGDAAVTFDPPASLKTNIKVPTISSGKQSISFLPDRVLVRHGRNYSDATYARLQSAAYAHRFIEDGRVPRDAELVDTTWQYVNVKGGPDRRYKNNRQLPVLLYGRLELATGGGLFWALDTSRHDVVEPVSSVLEAAPVALTNVGEAAADSPGLPPAPAVTDRLPPAPAVTDG
jgi:hypothetical protein